jgi:hypothetical protein
MIAAAECLSAAVAETYWQLYLQPRDAWTFEIEIRPFGQKWRPPPRAHDTRRRSQHRCAVSTDAAGAGTPR